MNDQELLFILSLLSFYLFHFFEGQTYQEGRGRGKKYHRQRDRNSHRSLQVLGEAAVIFPQRL